MELFVDIYVGYNVASESFLIRVLEVGEKCNVDVSLFYTLLVDIVDTQIL
jgi:hypothetical protein